MGAGSQAITMLIPIDLPALKTNHPLSFFVFDRKIFRTGLAVFKKF